jgi:cation-transporting ATPase E
MTVILVLLGEVNDAVFLIALITINAIVGIIQEIRAKRQLVKLELLAVSLAKRFEDGLVKRVPPAMLRPGDRLLVEAGDQILADGILESADNLEVSEALLTGESDSINKPAGAALSGGSFVVAGRGVFRVTHLGGGSVAGKMAAKLKRYNIRFSPLQLTLSHLIRWTTYLAIMLGFVIYGYGLLYDRTPVDTVNTIINAALSVVPESLLLATTLLFAYGVIRMSRRSVLIQHTGAVEGFGSLRYLCTDKTGTLTSESLCLEEIRPLGDYDEAQVQERLRALLSFSAPMTGTMAAVATGVQAGEVRVDDSLPFSSERKYSAVRYRMNHKQ